VGSPLQRRRSRPSRGCGRCTASRSRWSTSSSRLIWLGSPTPSIGVRVAAG